MPSTPHRIHLPDENEAGHQRGTKAPSDSSTPGGAISAATSVPSVQTKWSTQPLNVEWHGVLRKRLRDNPDATRHLSRLGLTEPTIERFGLGLSKPRSSASVGVEGDALVYPLIDPDGRFYKAYGYRNIPGVTLNPRHQCSWMRGKPVTYYSGSASPRESVIVCQRVVDVWLVWQALTRDSPERDLLAIASSHEKVFPGEWLKPEFWDGWATVYLLFDTDEEGEHLSSRLTESMSVDIRQVRPPKSCEHTWSNFWRDGDSVAPRLLSLLEEAPPASPRLKTEAESHGGLGRFAFEPVDINGAFKDGYLYCTVQTLNRELAPTRGKLGQNELEVVEKLETVVVRSDRTVHTASVMKAPPGTKYFDRVLRLSDGTLIDREPRPNKYATWSWQAIKAYLEGRSQAKPLGDILRDVTDYLRRSVWLPFEEDYALLALTVPVTYTQSVFDSVPLLFLNGPAGSGKSEAGRAMARLCANASVCGQSSAASIARLIDESRGFVVLDDLESIGSRGGEFSELVQALKQSYNKETAVKLWTDVKTMRTERLNFFGVKMVNNTKGVDAILGSRMLRIQTRPIPEPLRQSFQETRLSQNYNLEALRDQLHTWAFQNVGVVDTEYKKLFPKRTDRAGEIAAPLNVFASLADDPELTSQLAAALARQRYKSVDIDDPRQLLLAAVYNLVAAGYRLISVTHVVLELRRLLDPSLSGLGVGYPEWIRADWVGKQLRSLNLIEDGGKAVRKRLFGSNLRFYPILDSVVEDVKRDYEGRGVTVNIGTKSPTDFCAGCEGCAYKSLGCEVLPRRVAAEKHSP